MPHVQHDSLQGLLADLPTMPNGGRKIAMNILNTRFAVDTPDGHKDVPASSLTPEFLKAQATAIALKDDPSERARAILQVLEANTMLIRELQPLCEFALAAAYALEALPGQLRSDSVSQPTQHRQVAHAEWRSIWTKWT